MNHAERFEFISVRLDHITVIYMDNRVYPAPFAVKLQADRNTIVDPDKKHIFVYFLEKGKLDVEGKAIDVATRE